MNTNLTDIKTIVVKIGTTLLSGPSGFDGRVVEDVVKELCTIKPERGLNVLVVSSGAVGCGMDSLGLKQRPRLLRLKQATAAVGQARLMHYYETLFRTFGNGLHAAQVLLSAGDLEERQRYLNIRNTIHALFDMGNVVPIVNENDSVAIEELKFGDNDTLAARVAAKIGADLLIILSDVDGLFDRNPARHPGARLIEEVRQVTSEIEAYATDTEVETSVGGMTTKLTAAKIACAAGLRTIIANGHRPGVLRQVLAGEGPSTTFYASPEAMSQRKRWIAFGRSARGRIAVDAGARKALIERGSSLLAAGITSVQNKFEAGDSVRIVDAEGLDIARGLTNYSSSQIERIKGRKSQEIEALLGRKDYDEVIHRDNLVIL